MDRQNMHIHSKYSLDSRTNIDDIALELVKNNIKYAAITDQVSFDREPLAKVLASLKLRNDEIDKINQEYKGKLKLIKGVEVSSPHLYKSNVEALNEVNLDFIMGSIHTIDKTAKTDLVKRQLAYNYYREILEMIKAKQIDVVGHIDYINRYYKEDYSDYNQLNELFYYINENNMIIEVDTSAKRICGDIQNTFPSVDKLKMYRKYKEEIIIGTDAHKLSEITDNLEETEYLQQALGFKTVIYEKRRMIKL